MLIYKEYILPHLFKCAGTSLRTTLIKYDLKNLKKITEHDSKFTLNGVEWASGYRSLALVRHPYNWYQSLYNFHAGLSRVNALSTIVEYKIKNTITNELLEPNQWLENILDLPAFFEKNPNLIKIFVKELSNRKGFLDSWFYNKPLNELKPKDFVGSFYALQAEVLLPNDTKFFHLETQVPEFLKTIGFNKQLLHQNVTPQKVFELTDTQKELIYKKDKDLFEKFGYEK